MTINYQLICTDIDGTLLNAERSLSNNTVSAFAKAKKTTILASSRMPSAMYYLQQGLEIIDSPLIAYNGGLILGKQGVTLQSNTLPMDLLKALIGHHKKTSYNLSIYADDNWFTANEDFWSLREINNTRVTPTYMQPEESLLLLETEKRAPHKIMCMGDSSEIDNIVTTFQGRFHTTVHFYRSKDTYLEITPKHIDKAKALGVILNHYYDFNMDAVIAFGDNHNDETLISNAGLGIAVANATERLKTLADYTSAYTNKEDAVAKAIEQYVL